MKYFKDGNKYAKVIKETSYGFYCEFYADLGTKIDHYYIPIKDLSKYTSISEDKYNNIVSMYKEENDVVPDKTFGQLRSGDTFYCIYKENNSIKKAFIENIVQDGSRIKITYIVNKQIHRMICLPDSLILNFSDKYAASNKSSALHAIENLDVFK